MGRRWRDIPTLIGQGLHKGLMYMKSEKMSGYDLVVVWLNSEHKIRETFEPKEIDKIDCELHFCDKESLRVTIEVLNKMLEEWEETDV